MEGIIFLKAVRLLLDPADKKAPRQEFKIACATLSGNIIRGKAVCTSSNFKNDTFNLRFPESGEIRKVHACLMLSVNGKEVML